MQNQWTNEEQNKNKNYNSNKWKSWNDSKICQQAKSNTPPPTQVTAAREEVASATSSRPMATMDNNIQFGDSTLPLDSFGNTIGMLMNAADNQLRGSRSVLWSVCGKHHANTIQTSAWSAQQQPRMLSFLRNGTNLGATNNKDDWRFRIFWSQEYLAHW